MKCEHPAVAEGLIEKRAVDVHEKCELERINNYDIYFEIQMKSEFGFCGGFLVLFCGRKKNNIINVKI